MACSGFSGSGPGDMQSPTSGKQDEIAIRWDLRPGDFGRVTELHGLLYSTEYGFDMSFEGYVAESLGELGRRLRPDRDRLWLAERGSQLVGSIGVVGRDANVAQLRWVLVHPDTRGRGLGRRLLDEALGFCQATRCRSVYLWTVSPLAAAARLYSSVGFRLAEEHPPKVLWGIYQSEQRYDLDL